MRSVTEVTPIKAPAPTSLTSSGLSPQNAKQALYFSVSEIKIETTRKKTQYFSVCLDKNNFFAPGVNALCKYQATVVIKKRKLYCGLHDTDLANCNLTGCNICLFFFAQRIEGSYCWA